VIIEIACLHRSALWLPMHDNALLEGFVNIEIDRGQTKKKSNLSHYNFLSSVVNQNVFL